MDIRAIYRNFYNRKPNGLHGALDDLGMRFEGRQHSGIDDARNTVRLCHRLVCDGCVLKITKVLPAKANRIYAVECSRSGVLTSRSGVLTNRSGVTTNRSGVTTSNLSSLARAASTSVLTCPLIVEQRGAISSRDWEKDYPSLPSNEQRVAKKDNGSSEDDISPSTSGEMQQDGDTMNSSLTSSQDQLFLDSIALSLEVPDTSQSHSNPANSNVFKKPTTIPSKREPTTPLSNFPLSKAPNTPVLKEIQMTHSPQVFGLTTPKPLDVCQFVPTPKQPCHSNEKKSTLSLSFSTPDAKCHVGGDGHVTPAGRSSFKLTPPMCKCGKRTREKTVYKEGPNKGKQFFSCTKRNGCNYFMWRSDLVSSTSPQLFTEYDF
jgi:ERI1 exoribonuclease 2